MITTAGGVTVQTVDNITVPHNQFTNGLFTSKFNGVFYMDGNKYPCTTAGVQQILADPITAGGGMVDARGCPSVRITSQINIANASQVPITFYFPNGAWTVSGITLQ